MGMILKGPAFFVFVCLLPGIYEVFCLKNSIAPDWKKPSVESHTWDFEFDEKQDSEQKNLDSESDSSLVKASEVWSDNDLCKNLQCKPHQVCLVEDEDVAVCVSKRKLKSKENVVKNVPYKKGKKQEIESGEEELFWEKGEENEKDKNSSEQESRNPCIPCPVVKPEFVCGSDNHTYSSVCRMEFRNCIHKASVAVSCKGFCPCKTVKSESDRSKEWQMKERWNRYMNKYQNTVNKQNVAHKPLKKNLGAANQGNEKSPTLKKEIPTINEEIVHKPVQNSVLHPTKGVTPIIEKGCTENELKAMGDRLLDWFSVVMADHRRGQSRRRSFRLSHTQLPDCKPEVSWMFQHLDTDGDTKLSLQELYDLENDDREHCLRPYLLDCDVERDLILSPYEWCSCFDKSQRPCAAALRRIPQGFIGGYTPLCDGDGYYLPTQCHSGSGTCWCVDRHGVEFTNTRRRGRPDCEGLLRRGQYRHESSRDEDQEDDSDEEEGSADKPLDF